MDITDLTPAELDFIEPFKSIVEEHFKGYLTFVVEEEGTLAMTYKLGEIEATMYISPLVSIVEIPVEQHDTFRRRILMELADKVMHYEAFSAWADSDEGKAYAEDQLWEDAEDADWGENDSEYPEGVEFIEVDFDDDNVISIKPKKLH